MPHADAAHLAACLADIRAAPRDRGTVELVVRRPGPGEREIVERAELDTALGLVGDTWSVRRSRRTPDGSPHPGMQVALMGSRAIAAVAGADPSSWAIAGDNLFVDLDLAADNLPVGTLLAIGTAVLEVTEPPHTGCAKFTERFGSAATRWLATDEGRRLKLRGIHARVVVSGSVARGDAIDVRRPVSAAVATQSSASTSSGSM